MSDKLDALRALLRRAKEPHPITLLHASRVFRSGYWHALRAANDGSLDAAMFLHEALLPEWEYGYDGSISWVKKPGLRTSYRHDAMSGFTSRSWLIAIIRALIAIEEGEA